MPTTMSRVFSAFTALLLACAVTLVGSSHAAAESRADTALTMQVTISPQAVVSGSGTLLTAGAPIAGAEVLITLDGYTVQSVATTAQGTFTFSFSIATSGPGDHALLAQYVGDPTRYKPSESRATLRLPEAAASKLAGSIDPTSTIAGNLITVTGKLVNSAGQPITDGLVTFSVGNREVRDSTTSTVSDGTFTSIIVIPDDTPAGQLRISARYSGNALNSPGTAEWTVAVADERESSSTASAIAAATNTPSTSPSAASPSPSVKPSASSVASNSASEPPSMLPWLLIGVVAVALFGILVTIGIVYRERLSHRVVHSDGHLLDEFYGEDGTPPLR